MLSKGASFPQSFFLSLEVVLGKTQRLAMGLFGHAYQRWSASGALFRTACRRLSQPVPQDRLILALQARQGILSVRGHLVSRQNMVCGEFLMLGRSLPYQETA